MMFFSAHSSQLTAYCLLLSAHSQMSELYHPECAKGVRWDDPAFGIEWPIPKPIMSERDKGFQFIEN
ncbi:dTDP-4-dehydrorhamnose 3,5-epimerase family protein [Thermodesulfovibrionales bacterium]|nr:dTDP-4-dehydrorhamnose 3,5-epimerase family protein [Thermodesulfovibrionales bacterium]